MDGREFIKTVFQGSSHQQTTRVVMNLPATAMEFLGKYLLKSNNNLLEWIDVFSELEINDDALPWIHCYCFVKVAEDVDPQSEIKEVFLEALS